jgi:hypothetical protein
MCASNPPNRGGPALGSKRIGDDRYPILYVIGPAKTMGLRRFPEKGRRGPGRFSRRASGSAGLDHLPGRQGFSKRRVRATLGLAALLAHPGPAGLIADQHERQSGWAASGTPKNSWTAGVTPRSQGADWR